VVLANPPYFSQYRISELFCQMAAQNLAVNRPAYFVTKNIDWYHKNFGRWFTQIRAYSRSGYHIIVGNRAAQIESPEDVDVDTDE
jgi:16S rRNA (guanine1207-N2)-methyltransferase